MAKRFIDSEIFKDPWFKKLESDFKLLWIHTFTVCDNAGLYPVEIEIACIRCGIKPISTEEAENAFKEKIFVLDAGETWFLPSFIKIQYRNELKINNKALSNVIPRLFERDLISEIEPGLFKLKDIFLKEKIKQIKPLNKPLNKGLPKAPKEKEKEQEEDKAMDKENSQASILIDDISEFFSVSRIPSNDRSYRRVCALVRSKGAELVGRQFNAYCQYKKRSGEMYHNIIGFLGKEDDFSDGGWCEHDWEKKLAKLTDDSDKPTIDRNKILQQISE